MLPLSTSSVALRMSAEVAVNFDINYNYTIPRKTNQRVCLGLTIPQTAPPLRKKSRASPASSNCCDRLSQESINSSSMYD
jgi:hypothetical protein